MADILSVVIYLMVAILYLDGHLQRALWKENIAWMKEQERINREIALWIHTHGGKP